MKFSIQAAVVATLMATNVAAVPFGFTSSWFSSRSAAKEVRDPVVGKPYVPRAPYSPYPYGYNSTPPTNTTTGVVKRAVAGYNYTAPPPYGYSNYSSSP